MPDSIEEIAARLERAADRYHNAADFLAERDARNAAAQVRRAGSVIEAQQIERNFMNAHLTASSSGAPSYQDLSQNAGCLSGWFGGRSSTSGPWRSTTAGRSSSFRPWSVYPYFSSPGYSHYTLVHAVSRHLPPGYSDPQAYAQQLANQTGLDPNTPLSALTPAQLAGLADAIDSNPNWSQSDTLPDIATGASLRDTSEGQVSYQSSDVSSRTDFASATPTDNS